MTVLADHEIKVFGQQGMISDFDLNRLQPASYDVLLASDILIPRSDRPLDIRNRVPDYFPLKINDFYVLDHKKFILASTVDRVKIPRDIVGRIEGKSSNARIGLQIHSAGYLDPGFHGTVTLEIVNFWPTPVVLFAGMKIAQLSFEYLSSPCIRPYGSKGLGSHYQQSDGVVGGQFNQQENN